MTIINMVGGGEDVLTRYTLITRGERYLFSAVGNMTSTSSPPPSLGNRTYRYAPGPLYVTGTDTEVTVTGDQVIQATVRTGDSLTYKNVKLTTVEDRGLGAKLSWLCPEGKSFNATISGSIAVAYDTGDLETKNDGIFAAVIADTTITAGGSSSSCVFNLGTQQSYTTSGSMFVGTSVSGKEKPCLIVNEITYQIQ